MRIKVLLELESEIFPKEKNRAILHFLKSVISKNAPDLYESYYLTENATKNMTFSTYLGRDFQFLKEHLYLPERHIWLTISTFNDEEMTKIYNCLENSKDKVYIIKNNSIRISKIEIANEREITSDMLFITSEPIVVRERCENNKDYYHDITTEKGQKIFLENLKYQIKKELNQELDVKIDIIFNKIIKVKFYGIVINVNKCKLHFKGNPEQIEYLYKSGIGSKKSAGFGFLI